MTEPTSPQPAAASRRIGPTPADPTKDSWAKPIPRITVEALDLADVVVGRSVLDMMLCGEWVETIGRQDSAS